MIITIDDEKYIDLGEVLKKTGLKQANLYIKMRCKEFPRPEKKTMPITVTFIKKRALWRHSDIESYIESTKKPKA